MQLADFCGLYPRDRNLWHQLQPARALPHTLREVLYPKLGNVLASNDRSRNKAATRMGVSMRPFQRGDRLSALSLSHFMRTDELMSRIDDAQGQLTARLFIVSEESLDFASGEARCTKGQTLLGVAAVLQAVHERQGHGVRLIISERATLKARIQQALRVRRGQDANYVLSDFLNGALISDLEVFHQRGCHGVSFFCVRDPLEWPSPQNPLAHEAHQLTPFGATDVAPTANVDAAPAQNFSGSTYIDNLQEEIRTYRTKVGQNLGSFHGITENNSIHELVRMVGDSYLITDAHNTRRRSGGAD